MKKQFVDIIYRQWEDQNKQEAQSLHKSHQTADSHREGFYAGFEAACSILRGMVGGSNNDE